MLLLPTSRAATEPEMKVGPRVLYLARARGFTGTSGPFLSPPAVGTRTAGTVVNAFLIFRSSPSAGPKCGARELSPSDHFGQQHAAGLESTSARPGGKRYFPLRQPPGRGRFDYAF